MEKNVVILDLNEYNELRYLKKTIEENKTIYIENNGCFFSKTLITTDKALEVVLETNKALNKKIDELKKLNNSNEKIINDIKKLSFWKFRKWRKS
jgi:hypothetical protein